MSVSPSRLVTATLFALAWAASPCACSGHGRGSDTHGPGDASAQPPGPQLAGEAGFLDLAPQPTAARYSARMFYVFQPADTDAASRPLLVLFNGGPGFPTSAGLLAWGTGRFTLDPRAPGGTPPASNPARWSRFANLLYLDERLAGFSYGILPAADCTMSPVQDAGDFVRALLGFLDAHPLLRAAPVTLVGESYGGVRATWMLDLLLRYRTEAATAGGDLPDRIQAHYDAVFPDRTGTPIDEATAATQFGSQVLVEPLVAGAAQIAQQRALVPRDPYVAGAGPQTSDPYDAQEPPGWSQALTARTLAALSDRDSARALLGVDLDAIPLLRPQARADAFERPLDPTPPVGDAGPPSLPDGGGPNDPVLDALEAANVALAARLGALRPGDGYYAFGGGQCALEPDLADPAESTETLFVANLRHVRTFITHARYDADVYAPAIPAVLAERGLGGVVDSAPRPGVDRPGWFTVDLPAASGPPPEPATTVEVRFPPYDESGHFVATTQPAELSADVAAWLAAR